MHDKFTQGTIINDIRSLKYPLIRCKGIVVSARCDLAQNKIKHFHCLTALSMEDWIYEVLFWNIIEEIKKDILGKVKGYAINKNLDFSTLKNMGYQKSKIVFEKCFEGKGSKELTTILKCCDDWKFYESIDNNISRNEKCKILNNKILNKKFKEKVKQLHNSAYPKFCFIPEKAYLSKNSLVKGLVVDLHDIQQFDINFREGIIKYKYDYKIVKDKSKSEFLNKYFFFDKESDFVIAEDIINSPWIEYLLQLFSNSFVRIGVDNAYEDEINNYCGEVIMEDLL